MLSYHNSADELSLFLQDVLYLVTQLFPNLRNKGFRKSLRPHCVAYLELALDIHVESLMRA